jgi:hypothetical protein
VLREDDVKAGLPRRALDHALEKKGIGQVFQIPQRGVAAHLPRVK